jgi:hypothetical protein
LSAAQAHAPLCQRFVTGLFADPTHAADAFQRLVDASFDPHDISVLRVDGGDQTLEAVPVEHKSGVPAGVTTGAALGGTVGVAGALALAGPIGLGLLAAGPIVTALQGAVIGVAGGGLVGALAGLAFWWDEPDLEQELREGAVLLAVTAEGERAEAARKALNESGAARIYG